MSEYQFVEKPFLDQLRALGWNVIDQGEGIPSDPTVSRRTSFREVVLPQVFRESVAALNRTADGRPWLTAKQLDDLYDYLTTQTGSLIEANENIQDLLYKHVVDRNYVTDEAYPTVQFVDFHHWERNHFLAINQLRIDTPGRVKAMIIPDIVLFVNGLPLVVVECKDANAYTSNPMWEAFKQLMRYSDQREETHRAGLHEGEPRLFHFNQLLIRTCGLNADFGTITSGDRHFYPWRDIYPASYRTYTPPLGEDLCRELSDAEILAIKRKYGTTGDILEGEARIAAIAADLVDHYISTVLPDGFKAQVVASSKLAAVRYCRAIEQALAARLTVEQAKPQPDPDFIDRIAFLKVRGVVSADGTNELAEITQMRKILAQDKAGDNFKRSFDPAKPLTGITFLVVCDMLLTGFDAPIEQVMYLDKQLKEHNLLQTIARVNRTAPKKQCGYIIDYIGLTNHLQRAFELYAAEAQSEVRKALFNLEEELPILESRFQLTDHKSHRTWISPSCKRAQPGLGDRETIHRLIN